MKVIFQDLYVEQGADFGATILVVNPDQTPVNVANAQVSSQIKTSYFSTNAYANLTCTVVDGANGNVNISMSAANTANLQAGPYVYDVLMVLNGATSKLMKGNFYVQPGVTNIIPPYEGLPSTGGTQNTTIWLPNANTPVDVNNAAYI